MARARMMTAPTAPMTIPAIMVPLMPVCSGVGGGLDAGWATIGAVAVGSVAGDVVDWVEFGLMVVGSPFLSQTPSPRLQQVVLLWPQQ